MWRTVLGRTRRHKAASLCSAEEQRESVLPGTQSWAEPPPEVFVPAAGSPLKAGASFSSPPPWQQLLACEELLRPTTPPRAPVRPSPAPEAPDPPEAGGCSPVWQPTPFSPVLPFLSPRPRPLPDACCSQLFPPVRACRVPWLLRPGGDKPVAWGCGKAASQACGPSWAGSWASASACRWMGFSAVSGASSCPWTVTPCFCQDRGLKEKQLGSQGQPSQEEPSGAGPPQARLSSSLGRFPWLLASPLSLDSSL